MAQLGGEKDLGFVREELGQNQQKGDIPQALWDHHGGTPGEPEQDRTLGWVTQPRTQELLALGPNQLGSG